MEQSIHIFAYNYIIITYIYLSEQMPLHSSW